MDKSTHAKQVKRSVISRKILPTKLPVFQTAVLYLFYDRFPPQETWHWIIWIVLIVYCVLAWTVGVYSLSTEVEVDVIDRINLVMKSIAFKNVGALYDAMSKKHRNIQ